MSAANVLWLPLGELLVERGLLSTVQLELALGEQRRTGLRLGEVLVSMGYVSEAALARMLLEQVGLSAPAVEHPPVAEVSVEAEPEPVLEPAADAQEPEREPEREPEPEIEPEPEPLVAVSAPPERERVEPVIVRMDDPDRDRSRWWSRNGTKARVRELEKLLSDFEERSRAIEDDITRVRTTLRNLRDARSSS